MNTSNHGLEKLISIHWLNKKRNNQLFNWEKNINDCNNLSIIFNLIFSSITRSEIARALRTIGAKLGPTIIPTPVVLQLFPEYLMLFKSTYQDICIIQCYAPTDKDDSEIETFYEIVEAAVRKTKQTFFIMVDFNAKVGSMKTPSTGFIGLGNRNERGEIHRMVPIQKQVLMQYQKTRRWVRRYS